MARSDEEAGVGDVSDLGLLGLLTEAPAADNMKMNRFECPKTTLLLISPPHTRHRDEALMLLPAEVPLSGAVSI